MDNEAKKKFIYLYHPKKNIYKKVKLGFSLTFALSLFFGTWIVPFFRKDIRITALVVLILLATISLQPINPAYYALMVLASYIVFGVLIFTYNNMFFQDLIKKGYKIVIFDNNTLDLDLINKTLENMKLSNNSLESNIITPNNTKEEVDKLIAAQNKIMYIITTLVFFCIAIIATVYTFETMNNHNSSSEAQSVEQNND